jgi:pseudaminic acid synthase
MIIGKFEIGRNHPPFIIAEMSANHNGSLERALQLVEAAAAAGAQALKLQTYTADTMTIDIREGEFFISDTSSLWHGHSLHELYEKAQTPWEWHEPVFERAKELGMVAFSSPFDESAVDFLEEMNVPCYKIASFENVDLPLIRYVAATGKPMIISTGLASIAEIEEAVQAARDGGCSDLVVLKCTSSYPATPENSNVLTIPHMRELLRCEIGLSDHTAGIGAAIAAVAMGATVVEKHFTLRRSDGGVDSDFSLEPEELAALVTESKRAWQALGQVRYGISAAEAESRVYRRSVYVVKDMKAGEVFNRENLRRIRPGYGLPPRYYEELLGKEARADIKRGTPMKWGLVR